MDKSAAKVGESASSKARNGIVVTDTAMKWGNQFRGTVDYFSFIREAAPAAINGDGRAAFYISEALATCVDVITLVKNSSAPEQDFKDRLARTPYAPQWFIEKRSNRFKQCLRLAQENAFTDLPPREDGYPFKFWRRLAIESGDPLAEADSTSGIIVAIPHIRSAEQKQAAVEQIKKYAVDAASSNDPEAMFAIGMALTAGRHPKTGFAVALAACQLGFDCTAGNPTLYWSQCASSFSSCPPGTNFSDLLQASLGPDEFSRVFLKAQEFKDILARDDADALREFLDAGAL